MADKGKEEKKGSPIEEAGKDFGWEEELFEETNTVYIKTNYPAPTKRYRLIYEAFSLSMEETYFWMLSQLKYDLAFSAVEKITDIFSSSENSSFFGQSSQRLGIQQDKIQSTLATLGKMVKDLFSLVRELRIIDERLAAHDAWNNDKSKSADVTLKQVYVDFAESQGGQTKPSSVYGLAQNLGYVTLPDFFFNTHVYKKDDIDGFVDSLPTNNNMKNVLRRKLLEFVIWREHIEKELRNRRKFSLHYLRQHWGVIKMYMGWMKPYLRNIKRLSMNEQQIMGTDVISAFETAALEIEILAYDSTKDVSPCILANFKYSVKPSLSYQQPESYQRGAIHVGKVEISLRSYGWNKQEIEAYKRYREKEEMELLGVIDASFKAALDALSEDLDKYLAESGEEEFKKKLEEQEEDKKDKRTALQKWLGVRVVQKGEKPQNESVAEPFTAIFSGFGEILGSFMPSVSAPTGKSSSSGANSAANEASSKMWLLLKNYKKSHQMLTW
jgi:hypothetical protein